VSASERAGEGEGRHESGDDAQRGDTVGPPEGGDPSEVYDLYRRGSALLESRDFAAATVPLERARRLEPDKTSIREALGRAYFHSGRYAAAREEFAAVVERSPVNDFAHFCLGRALEKTGRRTEAGRHLTLAAGLRPDRADYRAYLNRLRAA
jgi:tetratricopeptide (TPR) repeat protein